ncbi:hypothetical protein JQ617_31960 [Bradyrhizobium sp. KB893862 SZCCT0404]|uniref:hypothetical protein n=1 Tax=Bradyrhizobium sp. KB893862 SZCCT0404 TaxID=2807672 RepID=UPI001BAD44CB|nr:hypothetical protein [Bradyrhizobium sp. KB893862 SZCCT0404]MBR1178618.1 hypothetical protein [Bradyrhizobium sp. KB893862 SZCCT0404]
MTSSYPLRTLVLAASSALLLGASAQAGPIPTHLSTMKAMVDPATTEVRWVGGWRGGYGYRGVGWGYRGYGYRGGWGYRGYGYRGLGYGVAGAVVGGAIARSAYYGSYGGYYGGGYPAYGYGYGTPAASYYGYGGGYGYGYGGEYCPPTGSYWAY